MMKIKDILLELHNKIMNLSTFGLIICMFACMLISQKIISPFYDFFPILTVNIEEYYDMSTINRFLLVMFRSGIKAPILETIIYQTIIIRLVWGWTRIFF